jgi:hypothetical protein
MCKFSMFSFDLKTVLELEFLMVIKTIIFTTHGLEAWEAIRASIAWNGQSLTSGSRGTINLLHLFFYFFYLLLLFNTVR